MSGGLPWQTGPVHYKISRHELWASVWTCLQIWSDHHETLQSKSGDTSSLSHIKQASNKWVQLMNNFNVQFRFGHPDDSFFGFKYLVRWWSPGRSQILMRDQAFVSWTAVHSVQQTTHFYTGFCLCFSICTFSSLSGQGIRAYVYTQSIVFCWQRPDVGWHVDM